MKKTITICLVVAIAFALVCLGSCVENNVDKLREVNLALARDYSTVKLEASVRTEQADLKSKFVLIKSGSNTDISYEVQRLNSFGALGEAPSEFVSTVKGTAVFNGSAIVSVDGEPLDNWTLLDVVDTAMVFRMTFLSEIKTKSNGLSAKVTNPGGFLQKENFDGTEMTVDVQLKDKYLSSILLRYNSNGADVTLNYEFTR